MNENDQRIATLEQQLGKVISAMTLISEQAKNADLSAENQSLRLALANSTDNLQKSVTSATSNLDSNLKQFSQYLSQIGQTISSLKTSNDTMKAAVAEEIQSALRKLSESSKSYEQELLQKSEKSSEEMSKKINLAIEAYRDKLNASLLSSSTDLSRAIRSAKEASDSFANEVNSAANRVRDTGSWKAWMVVAFFVVAIAAGFFGFRLLATQWPAYPEKVQNAIELNRYIDRAASKASQKEWDAVWGKVQEFADRPAE